MEYLYTGVDSVTWATAATQTYSLRVPLGQKWWIQSLRMRNSTNGEGCLLSIQIRSRGSKSPTQFSTCQGSNQDALEVSFGSKGLGALVQSDQIDFTFGTPTNNDVLYWQWMIHVEEGR